MDKKGKGRLSTKKLVLIAMLGAVSALLMLVEVGVPFAPGFLKIDLSSLAIVIGGFVMGPLEGMLIAIVKLLLKLLLKGTTTVGVGELMDVIVTACYMVPAVLFYRSHKTRKGAAISLGIGTIVVSIAAVVTNYFIMFPIYAWAFKMPLEAIVDMGTAINPNIDSLLTMMIWAVLPFNVLKYVIISLITFLVYKRLSVFLRNTILK